MSDEYSRESEGQADQREHFDARERTLDAREARVKDQEARRAERSDEVDNVLSQAVRRDEKASARDWAAAQRDMAANLEAWVTGDQNRDDAETRQAALDDRLHSATDRDASVVDRSTLAPDESEQRATE